jgi:hypothetical protein
MPRAHTGVVAESQEADSAAHQGGNGMRKRRSVDGPVRVTYRLEPNAVTIGSGEEPHAVAEHNWVDDAPRCGAQNSWGPLTP